LHHEHIVPVHAVGSERGVHYYAMQFIDGQTLAAFLDAQRRGEAPREQAEPTAAYSPSPAAPTGAASMAPVAAASTERLPRDAAYFRRVAEWSIQAAEALEHAHSLGIVHRDIKPGNLLVDARGQLWVADFGLAQIQGDARMTMTGDLVGTLRYMSPEQALAKRVLVDHRTDIYSLGATLYELLTLQPAFPGHDRQELLRQIAFEEPRPPRRVNQAIPVELETVVLKVMAKNPAERYPTAQELADDLMRFLHHEPIRAKRPSLVQRARKWARRHPAAVRASAAVLLVLAASLGWGVRDWAARRAEAEGKVREALAALEPGLRQGNPHAADVVRAARQAEAHLAGDLIRPELRERARQLLADLAMLAELERIRLNQAVVKDSWFDIAGADAAYGEAFREYGIDIDALHPSEAGARMRDRAIALHLAAALDNWAFSRQTREEREGRGWQWLLEMAREADPEQDAWRAAFRGALARGGRKEELQKLATSAPLAELPPTTLFLLARHLREGGAGEVAVSVLRAGQQRYPGDFWLNHDLAFALHTLQPPDLDEAIGYYRAALALRPESPGVHVHLGNALERKGRLDEATACYQEALRLNKGDAVVHYNLGIALERKGRLDEAIARYQEALCLRKDFPQAHGKLGDALTARGRVDEAIACYQEAVRLRKDEAGGHNNLGVALERKGRLDEAIACYNEALRLNKDYALAHNNLGSALRKKGRLDEAITCFKEALRLKKDLPIAHDNLGRALKGKGQLEEAIACFEEVLRLEPGHPLIRNNLGNALAAIGRVDEAIACFEEALRLHKDDAYAHYNLGVALDGKGRLDEAIACYNETLRLKPDFPQAHCNLGAALAAIGRVGEAIARYQEALRLKNDLPEAHYNLGVALKAKGRLDEALVAYREALRHAPGFASAHNNLADLLANSSDLRLRDSRLALAHARQAVKLMPHVAVFWNTLGKAHYRNGDWKAVTEALARSTELGKGGDSKDFFFLAMAHWQLGEEDEARRWYRKAVQWMETKRPQDEELHRFRAEAAQLLGIGNTVAPAAELLPPPQSEP
jgi:tetratricopeptide (TPR) repeat protein